MMHLCLLAALQHTEIVDRLRTTRIAAIELQDASFEEFVAAMRDHVGGNLKVSKEALDKGPSHVTIRMSDVSALTVLKVVLKERGLTLTTRANVLVVVPKEAIEERMVTRLYDVRQHLLTVSDFGAPPSPYRIYDGDASRTFEDFLPGGDGDEISREPDPLGTLRELITSHTGGDSWTKDDRAGMSFVNGTLLVIQNDKTHAEIAALLNQVSKFR